MTDTPDTLCEDEGCPHHGTPHICVPRRRPASRFDLAAIRERMMADHPVATVPPTNDRLFGINIVSTPGMRDDMIVALDLGSRDYSGIFWQRMPTYTPEELAERERERAESIRRMGELMHYPSSHTVRVEVPPRQVNVPGLTDTTLTLRPMPTIPQDQEIVNNDGRELSPEDFRAMLDRIEDPSIPLPDILPDEEISEMARRMTRAATREARNSVIQSQNSDLTMQQLHEQLREIAHDFSPVITATQGLVEAGQRMGRALRPDMIMGMAPLAEGETRRIGFGQRILRSAARSRNIPQEDPEMRRLAQTLTFGERYGMGSRRMMEMDFSDLEARVGSILLLDTEGSFQDYTGLFGRVSKEHKKKMLPPKGSLQRLPRKEAPVGHAYAAVMVRDAMHVLGYVPASGTLLGEINRPIRFQRQKKVTFKRHEAVQSIPGEQTVIGTVLLLNDFLELKKGKRITSLHDEWAGKVRAVLFSSADDAREVRGFRPIRKQDLKRG